MTRHADEQFFVEPTAEQRARAREASRRYREAHPDRERARYAKRDAKAYRAKNRDRIASYQKAYRASHRNERREYIRSRVMDDPSFQKEQHRKWLAVNVDRVRARRKRYYESNKSRILTRLREWKQHKAATDPTYRLKCALRGRLGCAIRRARGHKSERTMSLIGCDAETLRRHIETLWSPGMSWANYGHDGWHVDHVRPCASFDLTNPEQQKACFHWTNLQPLWAADNIRKGDAWMPPASPN